MKEGRGRGRLEGKVALVTGAARGMGEAEARLFAAEGARVLLCDVLDAEGEAVAKGIGEAARYLHLDVTREADWDRALEAVTGRFGRLDALVNNAGIARSAPLEEMSLEDFRAVVDVNQVGVFLGMRAAVPAMARGGGGSIVNVSSIDGLTGMNFVIGYVASKFAVTGMTRAAALELAPRGIRVNSIHPGYVDTPMANPRGEEPPTLLQRFAQQRVPLGRMARPDEIARVALFLASDESSYCTGSQFVVDGGVLSGEAIPAGSRPDLG
jgi:3alpha(or 20beta)-hydroxysteroid dehydrogenase